MSRFLLAWELGGNFGHMAKLLAVGRWLQASGHELGYVVRDLSGMPRPPGTPVFQAPLPLQNPHAPSVLANYASILLANGYHQPARLAERVAAWRALYALWRPDVVVAEHAPTALLASRIDGIPSAMLGTGFTVPPSQTPMPLMRPWMPQLADQAQLAERDALASINAVLTEATSTPLACVADLFDGQERLLCTFAELDPYPGRTADTPLGVIFDPHAGVAPVWPVAEGPRVFVYLRPEHRDFLRVIELLTAMNAVALVCAPGITEQDRQNLQSPRIHISAVPYQLANLKDAQAAITYGSAGVVAAMLLAGVPQLMLPTHVEQMLHAVRVETLGAGRLVNPEGPAVSYAALLRGVLENSSYRDKALAFARQYADFKPEDVIARIGQKLENLTRE